MRRGILINGILGVLLILALTMFSGCTDVTYNIENPTAPPIQQADQFEVTRLAIDAYLGSGPAPVITAQDLFDNLNDGDTSNDPVVISVRSNAHYLIGHIPGAINIPWKEIASTSSLAKITAGKDVVTYCYTGHTGAVAATILNSLGYSTKNLKFGMCGWTKDADVRATNCFNTDTDAHDYVTETTSNTLPSTQALNTINNTTSQDEDEIVRAAAESYAAGTKGPIMKAVDLYDNLNDGDTSNDPIIVSVRKGEHYAIGHITGAVNIPWTSMATISGLKQLDPDAEIVVYCYTGHTGAIATTVLNMLGYDAVNLKYGMCGWTMDSDVQSTTCYSEDVAKDFAFNTGATP